ncbi:MAG: murein biosynthesis integral membrane protein MurJ [Acidimicrobiales bacterium]
MASGTLLSRITGFAKLAALGYALGEKNVADAFNLANNTPNIVYDLLIGSVIAGTVVPVFVDRLARQDERRAWEDISAILTLAAVALTIATLILVLAAPLVIYAYTGGASGANQVVERHGATLLLRLFAPQVAFYALIGLATAVLNARRRFAPPTFVPIANNLAVIAILLAVHALYPHPSLSTFTHHPGFLLLLGIGTTGGILVQALLLVPSLRAAAPRLGQARVDVVSTLARQPEVDPQWRRANTADSWERLARLGRLADGYSPSWSDRRRQGGSALRWHWEPRNPAVAQVLKLAGWTFGSALATQIVYFIVLHLAYVSQRNGGVTAYTYGYTFFMLPVGIVGVSIMSAAQPELAQYWARGDLEAFWRRSVAAMRALVVAVVPPAVGYLVLSVPIAALVLAHGVGNLSGASQTASALVGLAVGLPGFCAWLFVGSAFQAMQDTRTVFAYYLLETGLNVALAFLLQPFLGVRGLAFALSASYTVTAVVGWAGLRHRLASGVPGPTGTAKLGFVAQGGRLPTTASLGLARALLRVCVLSAIMGAIVYEVSGHVGSDHGAGLVIRVVVSVASGIAAFTAGTALASRLSLH